MSNSKDSDRKRLELAISFASLSCNAPDSCLLRELDPQLLMLQPRQSFEHSRLLYSHTDSKTDHQSIKVLMPVSPD